MKKILTAISISFLCIPSLFAQKTEIIKVTGTEYPAFIAKNQYKYPEYIRAKISFKNGEFASARVNYNNFLHIMKFIDGKGDTLEIANPADIDYIAMGRDSFFYDNGYYEWIASSATARLAIKQTYKVGEKEQVGAFGTSSPAKDVQVITKILDVGSYELSPDEVIVIRKETTYYITPIKESKTSFVLANKSNITKLFPKKNIEDFVKENKINLNKEEDLIDLMVYISKPK